jgi:exopolysaccharide biosynthesis protein
MKGTLGFLIVMIIFMSLAFPVSPEIEEASPSPTRAAEVAVISATEPPQPTSTPQSTSTAQPTPPQPLATPLAEVKATPEVIPSLKDMSDSSASFITMMEEILPIPDTLNERLELCVVFKQDTPLAAFKNNWRYFDEANTYVMPLIIDNNLMIPLKPFIEAFGGTLEYDSQTMSATVTYHQRILTVTADSSEIRIDGTRWLMDKEAGFIHGRMYISLNAITKAMNIKLYQDSTGLYIASAYHIDLFNPETDRAMLDKLNAYFTSKPADYKAMSMAISTGTKQVNVITLNPKDPKISLCVDIPDGKLNVTRSFKSLVNEKSAFAAINTNFFSSESVSKNPIGNVVINGSIVYGQSGITTIGITKNRDIIFSNVYTFYRGLTDGKSYNSMRDDGSIEYNEWVAYELNTLGQNPHNIILYTPDRGSRIAITSEGYAAVVDNGIVIKNSLVTKGDAVDIPSGGFVVYFGKSEAEKWKGHLALTVGRHASYQPVISESSNPDFNWDDIAYAMAGGPDLIIDGQIQPQSDHPMFKAEKFKSKPAPRNAIGINSNSMLLLVNVPSCTIGELKEIMNKLGAVQAVNLDGGGSTSMYYDGKMISQPSRELVAALFVHYRK